MSKLVSGIINAVVGLALFAGGGWFLYVEMKTPPTHTTHIILFASIAFVGALVIRPDPIFAVIKQVLIIGGPYIPMVGGRRAGDPPAGVPPFPPPPNDAPPTAGGGV